MKIRSIATAAFLVGAAAHAQFSQALPNGPAAVNLLTAEGNSSSAYPFGTVNPNMWHWNYDSTNFVAAFPIIINAVSFRANGGSAGTGGTLPNFEVTMASSIINWSAGVSGTVYSSVMDVDTTVVYSGSITFPAGPHTTPAAWVTLPLQTPFLYNPTLGKDFILQIKSSGPNTAVAANVDLHSGAQAQRYGSQTSATLTAANFGNTGIVGVCKIDYTPATGLYSGFNSTPVSGPAPLTVQFTSTTFTSDPGGVTSYAWDFQNDGIVDSNLPNPSHTYYSPGSYSVALTTTDATNPPSTLLKPNAINVLQYVLSAVTSGSGVGDLTLTGIPILGSPGSASGYTFISFSLAPTIGSGPFFGIVPDAASWASISYVEAPGFPLHYTVVPGLYPDSPFVVPPGTLSSFAGFGVDFVQVGLTPAFGLAFVSNVSRATF